MNRRTFLIAAASALAGAAAHTLVNSLPPAATPTTAFMLAPQPCASSNPLPKCPSRRRIQEADLQSLLNWWGQYGAGVQAWRYRGVPRTYIREWLFYQWEIVAEEHIYG